MRAVLSKEVGGPETLVIEDIDAPTAAPGEVVIEVKAIGVNFPDVLIIEDKYQFKPPRPFSPGGELSGIVKSLGEGVTNVKVGDRVIASTGSGGMREEVAVDAARLIPFPDIVSFEEAAAFIMTYGTSHYALKHRGPTNEGDVLLVLGAAGGVGLAAVELGAAMGAKVIAAASTEEKVALAKSKGAHMGIVYPTGELDRAQQKEFSNQIKAAAAELGSEGGVDLVYDAVGGSYAEPSVRAMNWEGRYLVIGFPAGIPSIPLNLTLLKSCDIVGVFWGAWVAREQKQFAADIMEMMGMYAEGKIKPHVSKTFPLEQAGEAISHLANRKALGKVVITV